MDADTAAPDLEYHGRTPYVAKTQADVLADLVPVGTAEPLEVTFIVTTQVMELHFHLLRHEWRLAIAAVDADDVPGALAALRRSHTVQESLLAAWAMLDPLTAVQYNRFRAGLGRASGFQSFAYRELEFLLGAKDENMLRPHLDMPTVHERLAATYRQPSLYERAVDLLARRGHAIDPAIRQRDPREPWLAADPSVVDAWRRAIADGGELAALAEALLGVAERHSRWRFVHYQAVRRIIGGKPGTGGSAGLTWLKRAVDQVVFPELWEVPGAL
jgi:tryptophan 2,3-dioxygenase